MIVRNTRLKIIKKTRIFTVYLSESVNINSLKIGDILILHSGKVYFLDEIDNNTLFHFINDSFDKFILEHNYNIEIKYIIRLNHKCKYFKLNTKKNEKRKSKKNKKNDEFQTIISF